MIKYIKKYKGQNRILTINIKKKCIILKGITTNIMGKRMTSK